MQQIQRTGRRTPEERNPDELNIVIVGLGLIGGSLAKALSHNPRHRVMGIDRSPAVIRQALECGAISAEADDTALHCADVILLCCYPQACIDFVKEQGPLLSGALVSDTCGVKGAICPELTALSRTFGFTFVGGHPMAGKEQNGFAASEAGLFSGASYLLIPCGAPPGAVALMERLARSVGAARTIVTTPEHHDEMIAFTSQIPHALACAYVMSPLCPGHPGYSAGSYRDVSRVARINETLWSELFLENREPLTREIDTLLGHLTEIRNAVAQNDREALCELLRRGREMKERLGE
ncbi:prephenate dehydrogenase [Faecalispora anaeroviscerum]|uniref:prephenate dehydrogenase n=1 Tax=Faecalispora anaeroviscerum TaxID=2991836 RepID=UPI0024B97AEC|nr:prephenate dehydrogenase [Faecalispora anaeroviscerum]